MKNKKISIIVPVYNVEKYLESCIDSILCQTYADFELILINDGSLDNSGVICDDYVQKDSRVSVFHKVNEGVSKARNYGIDKALGDYICFIDSDDCVVDSYLADFFHNTIYDADVYLQGCVNIYTNGKSDKPVGFVSNEFYTLDSVQKGYVYSELNKLCNSPCLKLFKRDIVSQNNIKFDETICYGEDHLFVLSYLSHIQSMSVSDTVGYVYFHRGNDSLSTKYISHEKFFYYAEKAFLFRKILIENFQIKGEEFEYEIRKEFVMQLSHIILSLYNKKANLTKSDRENNLNRYIDYMRENRLLDDLNFKNYFYFTINKIVKSSWLKKDLSLYLFFKIRAVFKRNYK